MKIIVRKLAYRTGTVLEKKVLNFPSVNSWTDLTSTDLTRINVAKQKMRDHDSIPGYVDVDAEVE